MASVTNNHRMITMDAATCNSSKVGMTTGAVRLGAGGSGDNTVAAGRPAPVETQRSVIDHEVTSRALVPIAVDHLAMTNLLIATDPLPREDAGLPPSAVGWVPRDANPVDRSRFRTLHRFAYGEHAIDPPFQFQSG
jgi:hypothetical protein